MILPVVVVLLGTGSAFATKVMHRTNTIVPGYRLITNSNNELVCEDAGKECKLENDGPICTWSADPSVELKTFISPTMCGITLHEVQP